MEKQTLEELEAAAKVILATPSLITHVQRTEAEAIFMNFRRTKHPYQICRYVFENSCIDYVVFETCNTLKEALIREWNLLQLNDINSIRDYLLQHVLSHSNLPVYVREKILQVIAIMIKRGSIVDQGEERRKLLSQVEQLIVSGELRKQMLGCSIICALLQEYASTIKSADIGLSWEMHLTAKKQFESTDLKSIFQLCVTMLSEICKVDPFTDDVFSLVKGLLQIAEGVLMWAFISAAMPKKIICIFEMSYESEFSLCMKLGQHWKDIMLVPSLVQLFFHLHWKIRNNAHLTHYSLNCLVQLASLNGPILSEKKIRMEYMKNYINCFLGFLNSVEIVDREAIGVSNIFYKLLIYNEQIIIHDLGENEQGDLVPNFFRQMARLTCHFAEKASWQNSMNYDESMFIEAFDNMLKAWNCLFRDHSETIFKDASKCIFDCYLKWHLSPPHGSRTKVSSDEVDDSDNEEDLIKFDTQLQCIGIFARQVIGHSLPMLAKLIEEKTYKFRSMWQGTSNNNVQCDDLYEDLHWLLMIAGHVLTKEDDGSTATIPPSILKHSVAQMPNVNINESLCLLTTVDRPINLQTDYSRLIESTDHVIWLVSSVFRLAELEKQMGEAKLAHVMSPTLSSTIAWFLQTWADPYLLVPENLVYPEACALTLAFGHNSGCAKWVVDFVLNKIQSNLCLFNTDPSITQNTGKLFLSLVRTKEKALYMLEDDFFWNLINTGLRSNNHFVPLDIKKMLMKGFMLAISPFHGHDEKRREYLDQILKPIIERFYAIIRQENFKKQYHNETVRNEIMEIIYLLQGVVDGNGLAVCKSLFEYVAPILPDMVSLISIYNNYQQITQLVLELFRECSHTMLSDFPMENIRLFYESCLQLVEVYVKHNTNRLTEEANAEEDSFNDILIFIDLLTNLLSREMISSSGDEEIAKGRTHVSSVDVCMLGLCSILPLMSVETLKFPTLCSRFYSLLTFICELHAEKIYAQPQEFLVNILAVIELGLTLFGAQITTICCEFIQTFSKYLCLNAARLQPEKLLLLQPFLKIMMSIVLSRELNSENYRAFGLAFHSLICCYKDYYLQLVEELISNQTEPEIAEKLSKAFTNLTVGLRLSYDRQEKANFENNFERFVFVVQGFLFIK